MSSVLSIFKILIKVPCYIMVTYLIFNIFAFSHSYLQMLSLFYTVNGIIAENNYIPTNELGIIRDRMDRMETYVLYDIRLTNSTPDRFVDRVQYGEEINVGVVASYRWILPFQSYLYSDAVHGTGNQGDLSGGIHGDYDKIDFEEYNEMMNRNTEIEIEAVVPAMKYYADLEF